MARLPIDKADAIGGMPMDRAWNLMRLLGAFTAAGLARCLDLETGTMRDFCERLEAGGYIRLLAKNKAGAKVFDLLRPDGEAAPRLSRNGKPVVQGRGTEAMWQAVRILKTFTTRELLATLDGVATHETVRSYLGALHAAGYLRAERPAAGPQPARWRLLPGMNSGPRAPMIQRTGTVFDPNLRKVIVTSDHANTRGGAA